MPRPLTPDEKIAAKTHFPKIDVDAVVVTGEPTTVYNCLAWTLGISNAWVWPWGDRLVTKAEFDTLYRSYGFTAAGAGEIAAFGFSPDNMKHGAVSGPGHGPRWESKLGPWLRIQHGLGELEGGPDYGDVKGFYTKALSAPAIVEGRTEPPNMKIEQTELDGLAKHVSTVPDEVKKRFEIAYNAWIDTWEHPGIKFSSNPADRKQSTQFLDLIALGPQILPLLVERLVQPEAFFALQAFDQLVPAHQVIRFELNDPRVLLGEQERALLTVRRWLAINS